VGTGLVDGGGCVYIDRTSHEIEEPHSQILDSRLSSFTVLIVRAESGFYLHLSDGLLRSGMWSMPTTNYSYTLSYSLIVL